MPRPPRTDVGDEMYHVINRSNGRVPIFHTDADYLDFEHLLTEIQETLDMRILAYVIMPNHWHLLLYPRLDKDLSKALQWLGTTHATRHHARHNTIGNGHVYQGRYKSFVIGDETHLLTVLKYIERNPVRANLVKRAEDWKWGSAHRRVHSSLKQKSLLSNLPVDLPNNYVDWINTAEPSEELTALRRSVNVGVKFFGTTES